jgi:hypothetical protein
MSQQLCHFEASRSLTALEQDSTIIAVIEMSQSKWLGAALVPGIERHPLKKLDAREEGLPADDPHYPLKHGTGSPARSARRQGADALFSPSPFPSPFPCRAIACD